jgi:sugar lactone lactonase YvrE
MKRVLFGVVPLLLLGAAYLLLWPVPAEPVAWNAPLFLGYRGPHAVNQRLSELEHLPLGANLGPEHVVVREENGQPWVWAAVSSTDHASGRIIRMRPDGSLPEVVFESTGRPLGFDFDSAGALIVADPMYGAHGGLLRVSGRGASAAVDVLVDSINGEPLRYVDAVVVASSGLIYFSDASARFGPNASGGTFNASVLDILEHRNTGRVLEYNPVTRRTRVLMNGLSFANGVALSADEQFLFVAETGEYRIWKLAVTASDVTAYEALARRHEDAQVLMDNLPGYPDNLMRGEDGRLWCGLAKPRTSFADRTAASPWLRTLALRLPRALWPVPPAYGHVFAFDERGYVLADLQDPTGAYPETTSVTEHAGRLYIQSLHASSLGVLDRRAAGF